MKKNLADIIRAAGMRPFESTWRSNKNVEAADLMGGRSHFYDASTMRYFRCRVAWCDDRMDGAAMVAIMSQSDGPAHSGRVWGFAIHDFTGHHLAGDREFKSRAAAEKALEEAFNGLDAMDIVREALQRERGAHERELHAIRAAQKMLPRVRVTARKAFDPMTAVSGVGGAS